MKIVRQSADGLSRQYWAFSVSCTHTDEVRITLTSYGIERRKTPRGRFASSTAPDRWSSRDERRYFSGLERPTTIPQDVMAEAIQAVPMAFYIGWPIKEHRLAAEVIG